MQLLRDAVGEIVLAVRSTPLTDRSQPAGSSRGADSTDLPRPPVAALAEQPTGAHLSDGGSSRGSSRDGSRHGSFQVTLPPGAAIETAGTAQIEMVDATAKYLEMVDAAAAKSS